jgi:hypothetical protein
MGQDQTQHLVTIYKELLKQNDHVLVLGYYRACSWSFGNWQPAANVLHGPSTGYGCRSESRYISPTDHKRVTQWDQASASQRSNSRWAVKRTVRQCGELAVRSKR